MVAPVASAIRGLSTEVPHGQREDGIRRLSVAHLDKVQLLFSDRSHRRIGRTQRGTMTALRAALSAAVDCGASSSP